MLVKLWMTEEVITITPSQSIAEADQLLATHNLRRIPVLAGQQVIGIVCDSDIMKAKPSILDPTAEITEDERFSSLQVQHIMTDNPVTVAPDAPIEDAAFKMRRHKIHSIPVVNKGRLVGIITETNIFNAFLEIFGTDSQGTRIELLVEHNREHFHQMLDAFKQYHMDILTITVYPEFSKEHQLVTIKTKGDNLDSLLEGLWKIRLKINRVLQHGQAIQ